MVSIKPSFPAEWVPDEEVETCNRCDAAFSMINRKHHCRACGKIFCADCSSFTGSIPSYVSKVYHVKGGGLRLCESCNSVISTKKKSKRLIFIFSLLPLPIKELEVLLYINKKWKVAATCVISVFKSIQYKTGYHSWCGLERRLIHTHWKEFVGHSRLMVQTLKGLVGTTDISPFVRYFKTSKPSSTCKELYCDKCSKMFNPFDILELVYSQCTEQLIACQEFESWLGTSISKMNKEWILFLIPWILQIGKTQSSQRIIANNLLPLALDDKRIAYSIYFECELLSSSFYRAIQSRMMSSLDQPVREALRRSHLLLNILKDPEKLKTMSISVDGIALPYDPNCTLKYILHAQIKQLTSSTKPWAIPMQTSRGRIDLLQKTDDLRKDRLVITTMKLLRLLDGRLTYHDYHVFPITTTRGWVEMIPNSKTLYDIRKTSTIQNYIISFNKNKSSVVLRDTFMYSCASNCILGYILGLGDRNLHNILICGKTASLAHIDFSYLLGHDPKNIESTEMKITSGMVDMLGGYESEEFKQLKAFCSNAYATIRKYTYFWYALFRYLAVSSPPISPHHGELKDLQDHMNSRLMPNSTDEEVKVAIVKSVDSNSDSWKSSISDLTHGVKTSIQGLLFNLEL